VATTIGMNSFGRNLGLQKGDALLSVNGISLSPDNFKDGLNRFKTQTKAGEKVKVEIMRQDKKGNWKKKTLSGTAEMIERNVYLHIDWVARPTEKQLAVRKAWIKN
jgi:C-terminal processing protease CtpA/Prc